MLTGSPTADTPSQPNGVVVEEVTVEEELVVADADTAVAAEADADAVTAGADPLALDPGMGTATTPLATCAEAAPMSERPSKNAEYMLMRISLST